MKLKFSLLAALVATVVALTATVSPAAASQAADSTAAKSGSLAIPITSTCQVADATGTLHPGTFVGTLTITGFKLVNGVLSATGTLTGTCTATDVAGLSKTVNEVLTLPITNITGTCQILHLELGPIHLDLLGLKIDTNKIVIDITAQSGPGNLLGNLLCQIAHLLDANSTQGLVLLLNRLLGQL